ncbi:MAG: hypothetical protein RRB13_07925 [bacterium]|nr:hypothetical protein [bacterium]
MEEIRVAPEQLYDIFSPILIETCEGLAKQFSKALNIDITSSGWNLIIDNRQATDFLKPFALANDWPGFADFLAGKRDLYLFLEKPVMGIVNKKAKFWVFLDPKVAASYFQRQTERPKDFAAQAIKKFPQPNVLKGLVKQVGEIVGDTGERVMNRIKQIEVFYSVADDFMAEEAAQAFAATVKRLIVKLALDEVKLLGKDISDPGVSPSMLERRLQAIFRVCLRLYSRGDEKEREGLKTLLSPKIAVRKKALELVQARLERDHGE